MIWIKLDELIDPKLRMSLPFEHALNLNALWYKVSLLRAASRIPFTINTMASPNRGYRTFEMQEEVYQKINTKRILNGSTAVSPPMNSMHLIGAACDISDSEQRIQMWVRTHEDWVRKMGMWFEHFKATPTWVHLQIYPPLSGPDTLYFFP